MDSSSSTTSRKSNKIRDIVRLQQILKKWKKAANTNKNNTITATTTNTISSGSKSIKFLKKTLSFSESTSTSTHESSVPPKGYVAVCVGEELKRFVIPTEYLRHQMFGILLREAEEEFGFQQEGVLRFPCQVELFEKIIKMMEDKRSLSSPSLLLLHDQYDDVPSSSSSSSNDAVLVYPADTTSTAAEQLHPRPQMCR